jgi:hypothetical protein
MQRDNPGRPFTFVWRVLTLLIVLAVGPTLALAQEGGHVLPGKAHPHGYSLTDMLIASAVFNSGGSNPTTTLPDARADLSHREGPSHRQKPEEVTTGLIKPFRIYVSLNCTRGEGVVVGLHGVGDSAEQLHATGNFGRALLATPTEPQQMKHERRVCHFPLQVGRGVGLRRRLCWPRAGTVYQRGRQHSGCADRTYSGGRNGIQNHLLGKTLSRLHRPIRLDSSRIRRQLVSLARAENGRMVVSGPPQIFRKPSQRNLCTGVR